jgi:hypothetical protein
MEIIKREYSFLFVELSLVLGGGLDFLELEARESVHADLLQHLDSLFINRDIQDIYLRMFRGLL